MGAEEPMMRSRLRGGPVERREDRHAAREVRLQLEAHECPLCGWCDFHTYGVEGWLCTWCRHTWDD